MEKTMVVHFDNFLFFNINHNKQKKKKNEFFIYRKLHTVAAYYGNFVLKGHVKSTIDLL